MAAPDVGGERASFAPPVVAGEFIHGFGGSVAQGAVD